MNKQPLRYYLGQEVVTFGGKCGKVVRQYEDKIVLRLDNGRKATFNRDDIA